MRAIQIGLSDGLSKYYVKNTLRIEDVTKLAQAVATAHYTNNIHACQEAMPLEDLPKERPYIPQMPIEDVKRLGIIL